MHRLLLQHTTKNDTCEKNEKYVDQTGEFLQGEEKFPPRAWTRVHDGTVSLALIVDDHILGAGELKGEFINRHFIGRAATP